MHGAANAAASAGTGATPASASRCHTLSVGAAGCGTVALTTSRSFARVIATYKSRRSSSSSSCVPVAMSLGMQPSTTFSTCTAFHSCPLALWMVERIR